MQLLLCDALVYEIEITTADRLLLIAALAMLGAAFGSFMNVVVYRLPRQMSLSRPASRCPKCEHPIRWHDNIPVIGWLILRGRCRDCGAAISPRYPLVEALMAIVSWLLAWKAPLLAITAPGSDDSVVAMDMSWFLFHWVLAFALVCAALIEYDGFVPSQWLRRIPLLLGLAMLMVWPHLRSSGGIGPAGALPIDGLLAGIVGMLTGLIVGAGPWLTWFVNAPASRFAYANAALGGLVLVGGFLGEHDVVSIALYAMTLYVASQLLSRGWPATGRFGWAGSLALVTLAWLLAWPHVAWFDIQLSHDRAIRLVIAAAIMVCLAIVLQLAPPPRRQAPLVIEDARKPGS